MLRPLCRGKEKGLREEGALKFGISEVGPGGEYGVMIQGAKLWRERPPVWEERESFLLLNPRLHASLRDRILQADFPDLEEHVWVATSGTSGAMKVVALSRAALEASARAVNEHLSASAADVWINALPLFHVGGLGILVRAHLCAARCEFFQDRWDPFKFTEFAGARGATLSALVPAQVHDLVRAEIRAPLGLRAVVVGGGGLPEDLRREASVLGWPMLPSFGLTEAASQVATARPGEEGREWLPLLTHLEARVADGNLLELRGSSLLTGWMTFREEGECRWEDPKNGGWYRTSDRVETQQGKLRFLGRADDLVKIRGELVDLAALERALQLRVTSGAVVLFVDPDDRNGRVLRLRGENKEALAQSRRALDVFPSYARPAIFEVGPVEKNVLGKTVRR